METPQHAWVGITTIAKTLNPGDGLLRWANKQGLAGKTLDEARSGGTGDGTKLHHVTEHLAAGADPATIIADLPMSQPLKGYIFAACEWWQATSPQVIYSEVNVASERLMVRGRIDLVRRCVDPDCHCYGEGCVVVDFKSGGHALYPEAHLQGDGYREIWFDAGHHPRQLCGVEFITLGGRSMDYRVQPLRCEPGDFLAAYALWVAADRLRAGR